MPHTAPLQSDLPTFCFSQTMVQIARQAMQCFKRMLEQGTKQSAKRVFARQVMQQVNCKLEQMSQFVARPAVYSFDYNERVVLGAAVQLYLDAISEALSSQGTLPDSASPEETIVSDSVSPSQTPQTSNQQPVSSQASKLPPSAQYLSVQEAADLLGVNSRTIYGYLETGKLVGERIGGIIILRKEVVRAYQRPIVGRPRTSTPIWRVPVVRTPICLADRSADEAGTEQAAGAASPPGSYGPTACASWYGCSLHCAQ